MQFQIRYVDSLGCNDSYTRVYLVRIMQGNINMLEGINSTNFLPYFSEDGSAFSWLVFRPIIMYLPTLLLSLLLSICHAAPQSSDGSATPTARTKNGTYYGVHVPKLSQDIFRGIPFAYAPRFQLAQSLNETWDDARPAIEPGLTCAGFGTNNLFGWAVGEDCLNVNVVRPQGIDHNAKLPVLVWIYGGGYNQGSNRDPEFNTSFLLQTSLDIGHPIVIVSINYRLSGFGFLAGAQVQAQGATNLGLRDQWKALEWIQENIGGFGGDPKKVTIWVRS